jgi:hypothetical protein
LKSIVARRNREIALRAECKQSLYKWSVGRRCSEDDECISQ